MNVAATLQVLGRMETLHCSRQSTSSLPAPRGRIRALRLAAAAAVLATSWMLWPSASVEEPLTAGKGRPPGPASGRNVPPHTALTTAPLAPPAEGLESRLRHCYVAGFKFSGPLADAAALLGSKVRVAERQPLTARVQASGESPVHLNFTASLPAWTLLEMMAIQTATAMELSGKSVVFTRAKKPVPAEGMLTRTERLAALRTLFAAEREPRPDELINFEALVRDALGSYMLFEESSTTAAEFTGTPRDVQVLALALNATTDQPVMVSLSVELISIPLPGPGQPGINAAGLDGILSPEQIQKRLVPLRTAPGVQTSILQAAIADPGDQAIICTQLQNRSRADLPASLDATFSVAPSDRRFCKLYSGISIEQPAEDNPVNIATQQLSSTTNLYFGQTLALGSFKQDTGHEVLIFVTPARADGGTASVRR